MSAKTLSGVFASLLAEGGWATAFDHAAIHFHRIDIVTAWEFIHHIEHETFEDGSEGASAGAASYGFFSQGSEAILGDGELGPFHGHELGVLFDESVLRLGENLDEL